MEEGKINESERAQTRKKERSVYIWRERERETEEWRQSEETSSQADGWEPHPGLFPLCPLSPEIIC